MLASCRFACVILLLAAPTSFSQEPAKRPLDAAGDPLPDGAIRRLGSLRWRIAGQATCLRYSPDGAFLAVGFNNEILLWDAKTGQEFDRFPGTDVTFSGDGKLVIAFQPNQNLLVRDIRQKRVVQRTQQASSFAQLTPDGKAVWLLDQQEQLILLDLAKNKILTKIKARNLQHQLAPFHLSADGKLLAIANAEVGITLWDAKTGQHLHNFEIPQRGGNRCVPLISPDNKTLAGLGGNVTHFWDIPTKKHLNTLNNQAASSHTFAGSFDRTGRRLALGGQGPLVYDLDKKILEHKLEDGYVLPVLQVAFSPDGQTLATASQDGKISLWNPLTWKPRSPDPHPRGEVNNVAFSRDGKTVAAVHLSDPNIHLWDVNRGVIARELAFEDQAYYHGRGEISPLQFTSDNQLLILGHQNRWNIATGRLSSYRKLDERIIGASDDAGRWLIARDDGQGGDPELCLFDVHRNRDVAKIEIEKSTKGNINYHGMTAAISSQATWVALHKHVEDQRENIPDDKRFRESSLLLWSGKTGKVVHTIPLPAMSYRSQLAISNDARFLATDNFGANVPTICHVATGLPLWRLAVKPGNEDDDSADEPLDVMLEFSADGLMVAGFVNDKVILRESLSGQILKTFTAQEKSFPCLAFAPDGKTIVTGSRESTILLWNSDPLPAAKPTPWNRTKADGWWKAMAGDAKTAYPAMASFIAAGPEAVAFLREQLRAESEEDKKLLAELIRDLASAKFAVRDAAVQRLGDRGFRSVPAFQKALTQAENLEQRRRLQTLLNQRKTIGLAPDELRDCRALIVLERIVGPDAIALLETMSRGMVDDIRAQSATAALERLKGQP